MKNSTSIKAGLAAIKIAGIQKNSFIDYPGKIAAVLFMGGCNFICHYCHNSEILNMRSNKIDFNTVLDELREQVGFLDGVVISGGEPTLHPHLREIITAVRGLGFLVKLDTNGTSSAMLMDLVRDGLVDYVAMDIKAPLYRYRDIVGVDVDTAEIKKSIDFLIKNSAVCNDSKSAPVPIGFQNSPVSSTFSSHKKSADTHEFGYMFRTTLYPSLNDDDIREIGELVQGAKVFQLQQFVPNDFSNKQSTVYLPYSVHDAKRFELELSKYCDKVILRGF